MHEEQKSEPAKFDESTKRPPESGDTTKVHFPYKLRLTRWMAEVMHLISSTIFVNIQPKTIYDALKTG